MEKHALLVIDIQNDYFDGGNNPLTGSWNASLNAKKILDLFRSNKKLVVYIQHVSTRPGSTFFLPGTSGVEIHANVAPLADEKVIRKHFPNSFRETELQEFLVQNEINSLVVCGMMTHMCIDATTRAAKDLGYNCTLVTDACATKELLFGGKTVKADEVHTSFLAALNGFYANVITTADIQKMSSH